MDRNSERYLRDIRRFSFLSMSPAGMFFYAWWSLCWWVICTIARIIAFPFWLIWRLTP